MGDSAPSSGESISDHQSYEFDVRNNEDGMNTYRLRHLIVPFLPLHLNSWPLARFLPMILTVMLGKDARVTESTYLHPGIYTTRPFQIRPHPILRRRVPA